MQHLLILVWVNVLGFLEDKTLSKLSHLLCLNSFTLFTMAALHHYLFSIQDPDTQKAKHVFLHLLTSSIVVLRLDTCYMVLQPLPCSGNPYKSSPCSGGSYHQSFPCSGGSSHQSFPHSGGNSHQSFTCSGGSSHQSFPCSGGSHHEICISLTPSDLVHSHSVA